MFHIFQFFRPTDVEVSKRFLSSIRWWYCFVFFSSGTTFRELFAVLLTVADLALVMTWTTWNLLDFRVVEKEKLLKQFLFAQPWWSRLRAACLAIRRISEVGTCSRKQIGQTVLHGPYYIQDILGRLREFSRLSRCSTEPRCVFFVFSNHGGVRRTL